ncbi:MAG: ribbon-helix-helix domain-containing protein [Oscillospiraceae bacterium]|nr:ribbon-helix-helix domain-containing protein [Oscillospiraceae bacterium]
MLSIRLTPDVLGKVEELASQSGMTRNAFIESIVGEYAERETAPAADENEVVGDE